MILLLLAFGLLAGAVFLVSDAVTLPARQRSASVARAASYSRITVRKGDAATFRERVLQPLSARLASAVLRLSPRTTVETVSFKLISAGLTVPPTTFLAWKGAGAAAGLIFGLVLGASAGGATVAVMAALLLAVLGAMLPDYLVSARARSRRDQVRAALPDALDLLAVSVEAGLGFDAAIVKITEHMPGPLSDELALALGEMRVGESRADALRKLERRVGAPELTSFVRAVIQADQLGISLGRILRVQAADTRSKRQATAEEKAMKAPIKMLFPTAVFIFPAMFIVILGPALIKVLSLFNG